MSKGTRQYSFRLDPGLHDHVLAVAQRNGETLADVVRRGLRDYAKAQGDPYIEPYDPRRDRRERELP